MAEKKINGRKRHIAVDVLGLLLVCICSSANVHDSIVGDDLVADLNDESVFKLSLPVNIVLVRKTQRSG